MKRNGGFTLVELMIYIAIFSMLAIVFSSILVTFTKVNVAQVGQNEVASQLNFVIQTIQREISNSSLVVVRSADDPTGSVNSGYNNDWDEIDTAPIGTGRDYLILKTRSESGADQQNDSNSPITIYKNGSNDVVIRRGRGTGQTTEVLNAGIIKAQSLSFTKYSNAPGRDLVEINLALTANNAGQTVTRSLKLGVAKAVAATFDTQVIPGTNNAFDLGSGSNKWKDGYINGNLRVDTLTKTNQLAVGLDGSGNPLGDTLARINFGNLNMPAYTVPANSVLEVTVTPPTNSGGKYFITPPRGLPDDLIYVGANLSGGNLLVAIKNVSGANVGDGARTWHYLSIQP